MDKKAKLEKLFHTAHKNGYFTGAWLYAEKGEIVSKGSVGWRDPDDTLPVRVDSVFDLGSAGKQFTASAVMLLRRRGLLKLDDEITRFFPEIPYSGVTVRHLLQHTGGLPEFLWWAARTAKREHTIPGSEIVLRFLRESGEPREFAPGERFAYSNTGYTLLAQIAEKVSGVPFEDFLEQELFAPAGMRSTSFLHRRRDQRTVENLAYGLVYEDGGYILPDDSKLMDFVVPLDGLCGPGYVHSTVLDLFRWDRVLREGSLLSPEEQAMMYTPGRLNSGRIPRAGMEGEAYGFGWFVANDPKLGRVVNHGGYWPGYNTQYARWLDADRVLVVLSCRDCVDFIANATFAQGVSALAGDKKPRRVRTMEDIAVRHPNRSKWSSCCGKYEPRGKAGYIEEVFLKGKELHAAVVTDSGNRCGLRLYPLNRQIFTIKPEPRQISFGRDCVTMDGKTQRKL